MELNNSAEMNEPPLLAIGRQSYDLDSAEKDCQASGSAWSPMDCNGGSVSSKNEIWHADWRPFSGDLSHTQHSLQAQHRAKRQHCWNASFSSNQEEQGPGPSSSHLLCDGGSMQSLHTDVFGCSETNNAGNTGFDFLQTGLNLASSSSSALPPPSLMLVNNSRQVGASGMGHWSAGAGSGADLGALFTDGDWKITRDLMPTSMGQPSESTKGKCLEHVSSHTDVAGVEVGASHGLSCFSSTLAPPLESEGGKLGSFIDRPVNERSDNVHGDFRGAYKRKLSPVDLADASPFDPQIAVRSESARVGGFTSSQEPNGFANFHPVGSPPMIPVWGDPHNDSCEYVGNDSELPQLSRGVSERTPGLIASGEETSRSLQTQPFSARHEPIQSQSHSLFARNLRNVQPQNFTRRIPDVLGGGAAGSTSTMPGIEHWPPLVGDRSTAPPVLSNWVSTSGSRRNNSAFSSPGSRERGSSSGAFEGSHYRTMQGRTLDWAMAAAAASAVAPPPVLLEHRSPSQMIASGAFSAPTGREIDPPDSSARIGQAPNSLFNSGVLASYFPAPGSGAPRVNRNPPPVPSVSTAPGYQPTASPPMEAPTTLPGQHASRYALPSPRVRREALLTGPVQSVLGLPFRGLHTLRADGDYRRQFLSEILNAMHHAFRSEDLNIEELVMLDPSIIYGGDAHDQHRDMRLDVDNMSYEELLALEERIGNVNTGLDEERISLCLRESKYSSLDATVAAISQESDVKCSICQEEFIEEEELGRLDCGHGYHSACIKQWLFQKNECPICKSSAYIKP